ncbi:MULTISPECIES: hypothetical protein [Rhodomicrobium]|uniref:hypothetical protein n=1 Tax=Rhodomicrobium TaxID=1068 RepID=UPI000B4AAB92|nr:MULTISPECIES: hypothetical protein [Rhodomicrobium]
MEAEVPDATEAVLQAYLQELAELSHRYGLGIAGDAELFILEDEDGSRSYRLDEKSHLTFS